MTHLLTLFIILTLTTTHAQKKKLIGTWKTVSVEAEGITIDRTKADTVSVSDDMKRLYAISPVGLQNRVADVRLMYSRNHFVFGKDGSFQHYMTGKMTVAPFFTGTYTVKDGVIYTDTKNRGGQDVKKEIPFKMVDGKLHLTLDSRPGTDPGSKYVLQKVK
ncbi:hypothetical protein LRS05_06315 [Flavobacterium sp. J372]|uniref:hypothetical protein n=1 Tax=Flavobacterium sp. J372 TaxID=2898436 RepID=UPI002150DEAA|nr:hypothetical protein [Flavobacterium sp. J372]MCR5861774.1 hypothetical protein [Flavobacterium sp. J372]